MSFVFSFQKVLDVKEKEKELAQQQFGSAKHKQMELEQKMKGLEFEKNEAFHQYDHVNRKTVMEIMEFQQEIDHVNQQLKQLAIQSHLVEQEVERHQQILIEKSKEAKMWNQWKAKSKDAFEKVINQKEQAMLDEMAVIRHSRRH
ncbi:flagellar export protein FliJ [Bacillus sp. DNRA2]|uniref:flagellar export protein FliJ n=1 Tax=Bacillus sp. DNRA2 TaxID=2723053 RepID=UPI00145EAB61|nr:flagellar export protein FliJ [Bacillus sp. DNRA2]